MGADTKTVDVLAVLGRHVSLAEQVACLEQQAEAHAVFDAVADLMETANRNERLFVAACDALGRVSHDLGIDPDAGGHAPILAAIAEIRAERDELLKVCAAAYQMIFDDPVDFAILGEMLHRASAKASAAIAELMAFNRSLVLNGRQRFNATPEQIALSDAAEAALRACGGAQ